MEEARFLILDFWCDASAKEAYRLGSGIPSVGAQREGCSTGASTKWGEADTELSGAARKNRIADLRTTRYSIVRHSCNTIILNMKRTLADVACRHTQRDRRFTYFGCSKI